MIEDPELYRILDAALDGHETLQVLDAGCGARFPLKLYRPAHITGIDISPASTGRTSLRLDNYIVGDIQTYRFSSTYDLVVCINVLEHVAYPEKAIANLASAVAPGGVLVMEFPNPLSLKGLITKFTPHSLHVYVLKHLLGYSKAGQIGYAPFPTYLRFSLSKKSILKILEDYYLSILLFRQFSGAQVAKLRTTAYPVYLIYRVTCEAGRLLLFGYGQIDLTETLVVAQRR